MRLSKLDRVHFVGIGGIGMSGIAEVLLTLGFKVSGSDLKASATTERLGALGAKISIGHAGENVADPLVVVYSSAVRQDNPEILEALRRGIPVIPRAEMLAELMRMKSCVTVAGSHGKTTVTAMITHIAHCAGMDPTAVIGGKLSTLGSSARLGKSDLMVVESDESDRSFLMLGANLAVITNIDWEHVDCYPTIQDVREAFTLFANKVPFYGACVVCADDSNVRHIMPDIRRRVITYGAGEGLDYRATPSASPPGGEVFEVLFKGESLGNVEIRQAGMHNVLNATAAIAASAEMGIPFTSVRESLSSFPGTDRRFQIKGRAGGITVVDDYGHHPTELSATLKTARSSCAGGRVVVLFQPHRFTRLRAFLEGFASELSAADLVVLTDVYPASEPPIAGYDSAVLMKRIQDIGRSEVRLCSQVADLPVFAAPLLREGDLVLTVGAGSITLVGDRLLKLLGGGDASG